MFALLALVTLMGAECTFVGTSGGNRDQEDGDRAGLIVVVRDGRLVDGPVQGVGYISGGQSGVTGFDGEFRYEEGKSVRFFIGDLMLGEAAAGKAVITPLDLVPGGTLDSTAVINIARLLQSLDSVPGDDRITIPATLQRAAAAGSAQVGAAIRDLDFADPTAFTNAASQLVASLTASYPFTASLVDAQTAREHLRAAIAASP
ncbi:MAG TPA: hypothetical protein ENK05_00590 [Gammaproteobacteria bacterium]|nr:hypothetical protein [Gammaproteobacteria bacterium]